MGIDHKIIQSQRAFVVWLAIVALAGGFYLATSGRFDGILFFARHRSPPLDSFFIIATRLAEAPGFILCALIALAVRWIYVVPVSLAAATCYAGSEILKSIFRIPRPVDELARLGMLDLAHPVDGIALTTGLTSFPSGHATAAFTLAGVMILFFRPRPWLTSLIFLAALAAGVSRVYLVQHYWADVYAGAWAGTLFALGIYLLGRRAGLVREP